MQIKAMSSRCGNIPDRPDLKVGHLIDESLHVKINREMTQLCFDAQRGWGRRRNLPYTWRGQERVGLSVCKCVSV